MLQDGIGPVVARGDAGADYRFVVDVPIPGPLHAGTVIIAARADDPGPRFAFGPEIPVAEAPRHGDGDDDRCRGVRRLRRARVVPGGDEGATGRSWLIGGVVLVVVIAGGLVWWGRRRARTPVGEPGSA